MIKLNLRTEKRMSLKTGTQAQANKPPNYGYEVQLAAICSLSWGTEYIVIRLFLNRDGGQVSWADVWDIVWHFIKKISHLRAENQPKKPPIIAEGAPLLSVN